VWHRVGGCLMGSDMRCCQAPNTLLSGAQLLYTMRGFCTIDGTSYHVPNTGHAHPTTSALLPPACSNIATDATQACNIAGPIAHLLCDMPSSCMANRMRLCTGFKPSRTSGSARPTMTDMAYCTAHKRKSVSTAQVAMTVVYCCYQSCKLPQLMVDRFTC
jgi:hypothetical protein